MPEMPKLIEVTRRGTEYSLTIDGQEFPWYVAEQGVSTSVGTRDVPSITLTLMAESVVVTNTDG